MSRKRAQTISQTFKKFCSAKVNIVKIVNIVLLHRSRRKCEKKFIRDFSLSVFLFSYLLVHILAKAEPRTFFHKFRGRVGALVIDGRGEAVQ